MTLSSNTKLLKYEARGCNGTYSFNTADVQSLLILQQTITFNYKRIQPNFKTLMMGLDVFLARLMIRTESFMSKMVASVCA